MKIKQIIEGKSPHKKGTKKYKKHMAAMHAENVNESLRALAEHVKQQVPLCDSVFRYQSESYFDTFLKAKQLREAGALPELDWESEEMLNTDIGESVVLKGVGKVWLDVPYLNESDDLDEGARETIMAFALVGGLLLGGAVGVKDYKLTQEWMQTYEEIKETDPARADEIKKLVTQYKSYPFKLSGMKELTKQKIEKIIADAAPEKVEEAEYNGKDVELNKPKRGGSKKYYVYVKNPKTGRVKKISFGDVTGLRTKSGNKKRAKSFAARHNCEKKNDKMKAGYWACRLPRYGLVKGGKWW